MRIRTWFPALAAALAATSSTASEAIAPTKFNKDFSTDAMLASRMSEQVGHGRSPGSVRGDSCYRTVEETQETIDAIVAARPDLASRIDIGDSWDKSNAGGPPGYDLYVLKLTNAASTQAKPGFFTIAGVSGEALAAGEFNTRFAEWLVNGYGIDAEATWLLDNVEFHLLLQANPDGRKKAEDGLQWIKNTNSSYCAFDLPPPQGPGVALNRNYPFRWSDSAANVCDYDFAGPSAGSEPETQSVVAYLQSLFPDLRPDDVTTPTPDTAQGIVLGIGSFVRLVLWPWSHTASPAPNATALEILGRRMAWFNGYRPEQSGGNFVIQAGTLTDYAYGALGVPAYHMDLGADNREGCASFENSIYPRNITALRYAARTVHAPYKLPSGPDVTRIDASPDIVVAGQPVTLTAQVDDSRINRIPQPESDAPPVPNTQNVASASYTVRDLPWNATAVAHPMTAVDGTFDSGAEAVQATLDTSDMTSGKHLVYVQGTDANGDKGAPQAVFVEVAQANEIVTVHGQVVDAVTQTPIAATVKLGSKAIAAGGDGNWSRTLRSGTVDLEASAPGYSTLRETGIVLAGGTDVTKNIALAPKCNRFTDDAEGANPGWTAQSPWAVASDVSGNATKVWTDSPADNYANDIDASLTSPVLNLTGYDDVTLRFDHKCQTEAGYDYGHVEVSVDGGEWTELLFCEGQAAWQPASVALPMAANQSNVRVRFRLTSDGGVTDEGWSIDNVRIDAGGSACPLSPGDVIFKNGFE